MATTSRGVNVIYWSISLVKVSYFYLVVTFDNVDSAIDADFYIDSDRDTDIEGSCG